MLGFVPEIPVTGGGHPASAQDVLAQHLFFICDRVNPQLRLRAALSLTTEDYYSTAEYV